MKLPPLKLYPLKWVVLELSPQKKKILKEIKTKTEVRKTESKSSNQKGRFAQFVLKTRQRNDVSQIIRWAERTQKEETKSWKMSQDCREKLSKTAERPWKWKEEDSVLKQNSTKIIYKKSNINKWICCRNTSTEI